MNVGKTVEIVLQSKQIFEHSEMLVEPFLDNNFNIGAKNWNYFRHKKHKNKYFVNTVEHVSCVGIHQTVFEREIF